MFTLCDRTAVVTGGSRGIGYAISKILATEGMNVAIIGRQTESIKYAEKTLQKLGLACKGFQCDVSVPLEIKAILEEIYQYFHSIDVLINCAGVLDTASIDELTEEEWNRVIDTNLKGTFFAMKYAIPYLERGRSPRIINISSNAGRMGGYENGLAYSASKGGIISLTYGAARRLAPKGITVNCVAPGTIKSDMTQAYSSEAHERLISRFPLNRLGTPEEVAYAVCYFSSVESGFTTGAVLDVNGGLFMG